MLVFQTRENSTSSVPPLRKIGSHRERPSAMQAYAQGGLHCIQCYEHNTEGNLPRRKRGLKKLIVLCFSSRLLFLSGCGGRRGGGRGAAAISGRMKSLRDFGWGPGNNRTTKDSRAKHHGTVLMDSCISVRLFLGDSPLRGIAEY